MAERIDLSTAGVKLAYAVESADGARPTSRYTAIPGIRSIPDINPEPSSLETTTLDEIEYKTYISGLKDPGGALAFGANNTEAFHEVWSTLVSATNTANAEGKAVWFAVIVPDMADAFYFAGTPSKLGLSAIEVDSVLTIEAYITTSKIEGWNTKPTN